LCSFQNVNFTKFVSRLKFSWPEVLLSTGSPRARVAMINAEQKLSAYHTAPVIVCI